ncbi:uncharacterized protein LOC132637984 [Lycium barbarum]|uniref:uncharacterized protein LOC132637984 n=1 Tax=Lycium barbarum TaxID=112863 RepID=UPI00293E3755|nr:uncharacterized protein LOC132637984 [Lycium barbarum]
MMRRYMNQNWPTAANPELYLHDEGYYVIKFQSIEDMHEIFYSGPYTINNRPIVLKPWTIDFDFTKVYPTEIPLWVTFPKLPMSCWDIENLSRIASAIGVPVYADECTTKQTRISYARMLIEVNVTQPLPEKIMVMDPVGKQFLQEIDYDWRPKYCEICQQVGHKCTAPPKQIRETGKQKVQHKKGVQEKEPPTKMALGWKARGLAQPTQYVLPAKTTAHEAIQMQTELAGKEQVMPTDKQIACSSNAQPSSSVTDQRPDLNLLNFPTLSAETLKNKNGKNHKSQGVTKNAVVVPLDKGGGTTPT